MAPMPDESIDDRLKDVIQTLYEIQSSVHGYLGPETQQQLVRKVNQLVSSLSVLSTSGSTLPISLPPEIIDYIDQGRNPDIYTRELVEAVQRNNQFLKGKSEAFAGFRDILAEEMIKAIPECKGDVERVLAGNGAVTAETAGQNGEI